MMRDALGLAIAALVAAALLHYSLSRVSRQFNFTQREQEVLKYLLQGLTGKAIANRMNISPNTVKAFLRMIMIKTGVSSRSEMVSKIIMAQPQ